MSKLITEALVTQRMEAKGWKEDVSDEVAYELVMSHYEAQVTDNWDSGIDFHIYEESTADGYELTIATNDYKNLDLSSDVYYYTPDLCEIIMEQIKEGATIYCEDEDAVAGAVEILYSDLLDVIDGEVRDELIDEGFEEPIVVPRNIIQYIQMLSQDEQFTTIKDGGALNVDTVSNVGPHVLYGPIIASDSERFEFVFNHFGLTIKRAVLGELIIEEWED